MGINKGSQRIDLTGDRYGGLTVTGFSHKNDRRQGFWHCDCDCGNKIIVRSDFLRDGTKMNCGDCDMKNVIVIGEKYVSKDGKRIIKVLGRQFKTLKTRNEEKEQITILTGNNVKSQTYEKTILKNYDLMTSDNDPRLPAEIHTPIGSQFHYRNSEILTVIDIEKKELLKDVVSYVVTDNLGKKIQGGNCSPEHIIAHYKPFNSNRDFVGEFQKALAGEVVSKTPVKQPKSVEKFDSWTQPAARGVPPIYGEVPFNMEPNLLYPNQKPKATQILTEAVEVMAERGKTYDKSNGQERSMGKTVSAFNALTGHNLTEEQGWAFMAVLKLARSQQGEYKADNYLDGTAYIALMGEAAETERGLCQ